MCVDERIIRIALMLLACFVGTSVVGLHHAFAANNPDAPSATAIRLAGCTQYQTDFDRTVLDHPNDPLVQATEQRLAAVDRAADAVLRDLRLHGAAFVENSLATVDGSLSAGDDSSRLIGAAKIVERFKADVASLSASTALNFSDSAILEKYLAVGSQTLADAIEQRGRSCMSVVGVDPHEVLQLSFILPMLACNTDRPLCAPAPVLPKWMASPKNLQALQSFAVESAMPKVAFALSRAASPTTPPDASTAYLLFLKLEANQMQRTADYDAALTCLREAIALEKIRGQKAPEIQLAFSVGEVLEAAAEVQPAADAMARLRTICTKPDDYSLASLLRLKYLHEAGQSDLLLSEAAVDLTDPKCEGHLPQIMFIAWMTARQHQVKTVELWKKRLIDRFPDHPLAADIYFVTATDALAAGDYGQTSRLLQFIEYRFPRFKLMDQVKALEQRLGGVDQNPDGPTMSPGN